MNVLKNINLFSLESILYYFCNLYYIYIGLQIIYSCRKRANMGFMVSTILLQFTHRLIVKRIRNTKYIVFTDFHNIRTELKYFCLCLVNTVCRRWNYRSISFEYYYWKLCCENCEKYPKYSTNQCIYFNYLLLSK